MRRRGLGAAAAVAALLLGWPGASRALDAEREYARGTTIVTLQAGWGEQNNVEGHRRLSGVAFLTLAPRVSYLPWAPFGSGWLKAALEPALEGWFQNYVEPVDATAQGLKLALRYNVLGFGPLVPYVEGTAGAGGTNLEVLEVRSTFTFVLEAGAGLSYFLAPGVSVSAGYRFQHISNGNVSRPNRGFNSDVGMVGLSFFFR